MSHPLSGFKEACNQQIVACDWSIITEFHCVSASEQEGRRSVSLLCLRCTFLFFTVLPLWSLCAETWNESCPHTHTHTHTHAHTHTHTFTHSIRCPLFLNLAQLRGKKSDFHNIIVCSRRFLQKVKMTSASRWEFCSTCRVSCEQSLKWEPTSAVCNGNPEGQVRNRILMNSPN